MSKETVKALRGLMIFAAAVVLAVLHFGKAIVVLKLFISILSPFFVGAAMAFIINLPMKYMEDRLFHKKNKLYKWKRPISFMLALLSIAVVLWIVVMLIVPQLSKTISELAVEIPTFVKHVITSLEQLFKDNPRIQEYIDSFDISRWDWNSIISKAVNTIYTGFGNMLLSTFTVASTIFNIVFDFIIALVFAIYLLMQKETLSEQGYRLLRAYLPKKLYAKVTHVLKLLYKNFSSFISSQCLEAVILGTLFVIVMTILDFPYAVLIGTLIAVTALVPIVGAFVGCVVGAFLILVDTPIKAVYFVIMFLILQQLEGNLIYPRVVGSSVGLPPIWVLVAVSVGGSLFGVVGMLVFIPITSTLYTLLREDVNERNSKK